MKYYFDYLKTNKFTIKYICFNEKLDITNYSLFDPIDIINLPGTYNVVESPNFLLTKDIYSKYRDKTKNFLFNAFYNFTKKEINLIPDIKSKDKFNRKPLPNIYTISIV